MKQSWFLKAARPKDYFISGGMVLASACICFAFGTYISYHITALILLLTVSIVASLYDILPVLLSAVLSAIILNFFFIPPLYTLHVQTPEDLLMLLMFLGITIVNAIFTYRIRREERKTRERAARRETLKLYNTLFNSLSHELKTPIATVIGAADMLKENPGLPETSRSELITEIELAGHRLHSQVKNLLDMSRLESGLLTVKRDWCDVVELLYKVIDDLKTDTHVMTLLPAGNLPLFRLDGGLIKQAVSNIVHNAVQYAPQGSSITISAKEETGTCIIVISDNGPGFPEGTAEQLFNKFYRLPDSKAGGTGLGLSIAKGFVQAHGGTITAQNIVPHGARFILAIPAETTYLNNLKHE